MMLIRRSSAGLSMVVARPAFVADAAVWRAPPTIRI
jgi:hypothetical protein